MKVFISWSGPASRRVGEALYSWLPQVLQYVDPFLSSEDIAKGDRWLNTIGRNLEASAFGVLCLTGENIGAPWINYEAGALAARFDESHVAPFLHGIKFADISGPLASFNGVQSEEREDVARLVCSINSCAETGLTAERLNLAFDRWWPDLEGALAQIEAGTTIPARASGSPEVRGAEEKLDELLLLVRRMDSGGRSTEPEPSSKALYGGRSWRHERNLTRSVNTFLRSRYSDLPKEPVHVYLATNGDVRIRALIPLAAEVVSTIVGEVAAEFDGARVEVIPWLADEPVGQEVRRGHDA